MTTACVTGSAGFIGSHIAEALLTRGFNIIVLDDLSTGTTENFKQWWDNNKCTFVQGSVVDVDTLRKCLKGVDYVFHNAAAKCTYCAEMPINDLAVNVLGTLNVIRIAYESGVKKVIHASTGSVNEINSFYGNSKAAGERYYPVFRNYHPDFTYTVLRYHHVYGPRQDSSDKSGVIPIFIRKIYNNEPVTIHGDGLQTRHFTHVSDVVRANLFCLDNGDSNNSSFDLLNIQATTINDLSTMLCNMMGKQCKIEYLPEKPGDIKEFHVNSNEFLSLGYNFEVNLVDGLHDTIDWYAKKWESRNDISSLST